MSTNEHGRTTPYWKRAHRDWRVWLGVILMIVAIIVYTTSGDLIVRPGTREPLPSSAGK
jgi:uncharacterized SAM-binding protein YcdF (DUF218 family)